MANEKAHTIVMSGGSGFVGSNLKETFQQKGWQVISLTREDFSNDINELALKMQEADVVINLAGAPVIDRWTEKYKKTLYDSRINVTRALVQAIAKQGEKPDLFISTSAVGYYADQGSHTEEEYVQADNFLGSLAQNWEKEAFGADNLGIRTVVFRLGVILGNNGGPLKKMLTPFRLGLGGPIGNGLQPFSWLHIKDLIRVYLVTIDSSSYSGVYNLTAPKPTTNLGLTKALGKALSRPTIFRVPKFILTARFGEGAQVITGGQRVIPKRLLESGFEFEFPDIESAVADCASSA